MRLTDDPAQTRLMLIGQAQFLQLPVQCVEGLVEHLIQGRETSSALTAILSNDLRGTFAQADDVTLKSLPEIIQFLEDNALPWSWGSYENVQTWRSRGGLRQFQTNPR